MTASSKKNKKSRTEKDTDPDSLEQRVEDFAQEIEHLGNTTGKRIEKSIKIFGKELEQAGKRVEKHAEEIGDNWNTWWDQTFGPIGPLLISCILVVSYVLFLEVLLVLGQDFSMVLRLHDFFFEFWFVFIIAFFFFTYASYVNRKYHHVIRFISPVISALGIAFTFWVVINVFSIIDIFVTVHFFKTIADIMILIFPIIILLSLVIGYMGLAFTTVFRKESYKQYRYFDTDEADEELTPEEIKKQQTGSYKHLYRSAQHRIFGGVCGGIGEYLNIDSVVIRLLFIIGFFLSFGSMVLLYFFFWIIIPRNPKHNWKK